MITCPFCNTEITSSYLNQLNKEIISKLDNLLIMIRPSDTVGPKTATAELKLLETPYRKLDQVLDIMHRMIIFIGHRVDCDSLLNKYKPEIDPTQCNCGFHELKRDINVARSS